MDAQTRTANLILDIATHRDKQAFEQIYENYAGRVKRFYINKGAADEVAESLTHDVLATVWQHAHVYDADKHDEKTWIYLLTRNRWTLYYRGNDRVELELDDAMFVPNR